MKKKIFLLFIMFFSITATASTIDISCGLNYGYGIRQFTIPGEKEPSLGLVNNSVLRLSDKNNYVWTSMHTKSIKTCSIFDEGFKMGAENPAVNIKDLHADEIVPDNLLLKEIFSCFCILNPELLNNCTMTVSYIISVFGEKYAYDNELICVDGSMKENKRKFYSLENKTDGF
ncbi:MAG: hypothetical protein NTY22_03325 [Proteobacteria bacterium]|nr:hypothetical protein [Pseudomonadota bacterium]